MSEFYSSLPYDKTDPRSIEKYAQRLIGHTFREVDSWAPKWEVHEEPVTYGEKARKGGLGNLLEERYFGYKANSISEADFPEAGVELKVTPYELRNNNRMVAGERLVLTMISYENAVEPELRKSHLWAKCQLMLLIYYLRNKLLESNLDYRIDYAKLFTPPAKDLEIILQDYNYIISKIAEGKADELSEADTMYLGACTKGATAEKSTVPQMFYAPDVLARKRAFCFKTSYMTYILNNYIAADVDTYESVLDSSLGAKSFGSYISERIQRYVGKTDRELCELFDRPYNNNKAQWIDLAYRMLGIKSNKAEEFEKAQIVVKATRVEEDLTITESSPLPPFTFKTLADESWEDSELYNYFSETKFFFVVFQKKGDSYILRGSRLWNMPTWELDHTVYNGWRSIQKTVQDGVVLTLKKQKNGIVVENNFPKKSANPVIHIRPHAQKSYYVMEDGRVYGNGKLSDSDELPDGRRMTKQSFWINNSYIFDLIKDLLKP